MMVICKHYVSSCCLLFSSNCYLGDTMTKEEIYNVKTTRQGYRIVKYDFLLNIERVYEIYKEGRSVRCLCAAGEKPTCRHREMLFIFMHKNKINTHWFLNYTGGIWEEHIKIPKPGEV